MDKPFGGCACNAIRFEVSAPFVPVKLGALDDHAIRMSEHHLKG